MPLSYEMGMYGACLTPVKVGQPEHRDTLPSEAEKTAAVQHITVCCSRSRSPRLVLAL